MRERGAENNQQNDDPLNLVRDDPYAGSAYYATEHGGNSQENVVNDDLMRQI